MAVRELERLRPCHAFGANPLSSFSALQRLRWKRQAGGPELEKFLFVGMRIMERISLRHFSGKYRDAEGPSVLF